MLSGIMQARSERSLNAYMTQEQRSIKYQPEAVEGKTMSLQLLLIIHNKSLRGEQILNEASFVKLKM
jgi:hypothetical protein